MPTKIPIPNITNSSIKKPPLKSFSENPTREFFHFSNINRKIKERVLVRTQFAILVQ